MASVQLFDTDTTSSSKYMPLMEAVALVCYERENLKYSAELKHKIHSQVNALIETLKEREQQLFMAIDKHDLEHFYLSTQTSGNADKSHSNDRKESKENISALKQKKIEFVSHSKQMTFLLQQFGRLELVDPVDEITDCPSEIPIYMKLSPRLEDVSSVLSDEGTRKFNKTKQNFPPPRCESTGSLASFEVIDESEACNAMFHDCSDDEDDMVFISKPVSLQTCMPSFPIPEVGNSSCFAPMCNLDWIPSVIKDSAVVETEAHFSAVGYQDPSQSPDDITDRLMNFRKQLKSFLRKEKPEAQSQLDEPISNLQNSTRRSDQSPGLGVIWDSPSMPSAIIQETFNKYLVQSSPEKWLASS